MACCFFLPYPFISMSKKRFPTGLVIGSVLVVGLASAAWFYFGNKTEKAPELITAPVAKGEITQVVTASGDLQPVTSVEVSSQVSGLIKEVLVDYNSPVKQGDVLARLDPATYEQKLKQAEADMASTKANTTLVSLNTDRTRELFKKQLVTQQELDQAEAQLAQAKASLLTRTASVEDARVNLSRCTIYAPIDGMVMQRAAEVGKTVAASLNAPTLFIIANELAKMQIVAAVAEADVGNIENNQPVNFTVDAFPNRQFRGKVIQIRNYPKTTSNVVTYETIIEVNNDDLKLKPGMTANVSIIVAQRRDAIKIPNAALRIRVPDELIVKKAEPAAEKGAAVAKAGEEKKPLSEEERRKVMREIMTEVGFSRDSGPPTPEMMQRVQQLAKERGIEFDPSRFGGRRNRQEGGASQSGNAPVLSRTVYKLVSSDPAKPLVEPVTVKLGISDGIATEALSGLSEGDQVVTSVVQAGAPAAQAAGSNPFAGGMGGGNRSMGGMGGGRR